MIRHKYYGRAFLTFNFGLFSSCDGQKSMFIFLKIWYEQLLVSILKVTYVLALISKISNVTLSKSSFLSASFSSHLRRLSPHTHTYTHTHFICGLCVAPPYLDVFVYLKSCCYVKLWGQRWEVCICVCVCVRGQWKFTEWPLWLLTGLGNDLLIHPSSTFSVIYFLDTSGDNIKDNGVAWIMIVTIIILIMPFSPQSKWIFMIKKFSLERFCLRWSSVRNTHI